MDFIFHVRNRKRGNYAIQENKGGIQIKRTGGSVRTKEEARRKQGKLERSKEGR